MHVAEAEDGDGERERPAEHHPPPPGALIEVVAVFDLEAVEGERRQVVAEALNDGGQLIQRNRVRPVGDTRPVAGEIDGRFLYPGLA